MRSEDASESEVLGGGEIRPVRSCDPRFPLLEQAIGSAPGISASARLDELRDEWER